MTEKPPIFIVGLPRSGTTLLTAMLGAHSRLSCGPETHFFDGLTDRIAKKICSEKMWPKLAVYYLFTIMHGESSVPVSYNINRKKISDYLRDKDRTITSIASALPELFMQNLGKMRWIDKTPDHTMHADKIRKHFPDAPIILILRDPRDVALSLVNVPWGPSTFLEALIYCHKYYRYISTDFFKTDPNTYTIRYEDLIASPESELQKLCHFLQESFESSMLDTKQTAANINNSNDSWMKKAEEKVDPSRALAWMSVLTDEQKRQADAIVGDYTEERDILTETLTFVQGFGFDRATDSYSLDFLTRVIEESDVRFWPASAEEAPAGNIFISSLESETWLGQGDRWERLGNALLIAKKILYYRMRDEPFVWPWIAGTHWNDKGYCAKLLSISYMGQETPVEWAEEIHQAADRDST